MGLKAINGKLAKGHAIELVSQQDSLRRVGARLFGDVSDPAQDWKDRRFDPRPIVQTNRQRLMNGGARKAMVWAAMPKPDAEQ